MPTLDMTNRAALVTGAAGGLGLAAARALAEQGARVVLSDLPGDRLEHALGTLLAEGHDAVALAADLSDAAAAADLPGRAHVAAGGLDVLVNCAGVMQTKPFLELTAHDWDRVVAVDLTSTFLVMQAAGRLMKTVGRGAIVSYASVAARIGRPDAAHYSAAKTGVLSLTRSAAHALAPQVRVNAVCPGLFRTDMWDGIMAERTSRFGPQAGQAYLDAALRATPLGRGGRVEECAAVVLFLASDLASYVTGQAINVDGGLEMD